MGQGLQRKFNTCILKRNGLGAYVAIDTMNNDREQEEDIVGSAQVSSSSSRKERKRKSRCWLSFTRLDVGVDGEQRAVCNKCGVDYKCDPLTGTTSMLRHHDICYTSGNVASPRSATRSSKFHPEKFTELLIEAIIKHDLPFSFVEYEGIRAVFDYVCPSLRLPCRNTVKAHVSKLYESEKSKVQNMLSCARGRICLTSDLWSSQTTNEYLTLTAHFLDTEWKLHKRILIFSYMPPPHNGSALAEKINSLICEWEIDKNLFSITLDNASANDSFVEKLRTQLNFRGLLLLNGKFFHVRCCAHILNLIVQDGLKAIDDSVVKVRDCLKYIKGSMARKHRFIECIAQVGMRGSKRALRQDLPTRWNSTYIMLDSAIHYRRALINFALIDSDFKCCPSPDEWDRIQTIYKFLGYFYEIMA
ncbi:zinc finger BED domain-containing protein RICESLEEPER 2-like [Argentina anserina]|uniref:zinc finger BED domain-containing protein RICESLEEPER 2-like n=1 Tax=Argentina anserina TaxID=57926 RepID=UPI00217642D6|nr:zinc finger BED domain-containing protein RICESLEEPER 2-like [Potentilla anserina]